MASRGYCLVGMAMAAEPKPTECTVNIRLSQAAEYLLFAWVRVGVTSS